MSFSSSSPYPGQSGQPGQPTYEHTQPTERVGRGLLAAAAAVLGGIVLTVVIFRLGYVASITSLVIAFGAAYLYEAAAGRSPRKGLVPLLVLVVVGVAVAFLAMVASDAWTVYDDFGITEVSRTTFIREAVLDPEILKEYGKDLALFIVFAVVGIVAVGRRMFAAR